MNINLDTLIMRQFINTLTITLVFLTSISALASSRQFEVEVNKSQVLNIKISNIDGADQLILKDENDEILFQDKSLFQPYIKNISLQNLPNGSYLLSLEDNDMISTKIISKSKTGVSISDTAVAFKPDFKQEENDRKVKVAFSNPTMQPTLFKVFDENGNLIAKFKNRDAILKKTVDFSKVPSGVYSIAISNKGRNYYQNVTIK